MALHLYLLSEKVWNIYNVMKSTQFKMFVTRFSWFYFFFVLKNFKWINSMWRGALNSILCVCVCVSIGLALTIHSLLFHSLTYLVYLLNPSSPKGGCKQSPKQFSPWCSKSRSQGVKLLREPSSSSFSFILAKKISNLPPILGVG